MPSPTERRNALVRRRIKFVVEKGAMARLFRKGSHRELQGELFRRIDLIRLTSIGSQKEYDDWLKQNIKLDCWKHYCSDAIERVRWAYFAKLLNIVIYEIVSNHELVSESDWNNLKNFLHLPIDKIVQNELHRLDPVFRPMKSLKGMTESQYDSVQKSARDVAMRYSTPPISIEAAWSAARD